MLLVCSCNGICGFVVVTAFPAVLRLVLQGGGVVNVRGMVQNVQGRVSNYGGIVGNAYGEVFNASGACKNVGGRVQNIQGFVDNHGGTVLNTPTAAKNPPGSPQLSPLSAAATPIATNPLAAYQVPVPPKAPAATCPSRARRSLFITCDFRPCWSGVDQTRWHVPDA